MDHRSQTVIAFLLGVVAALGVALLVQAQTPLLSPAYAQAAAGGSGRLFIVTGTGTQGQSRDVVFLVDQEANRLAVYEYKDKVLELGAVRNIEYELRFETWSPRGKDQRPTVKEMKDATEKEEKR